MHFKKQEITNVLDRIEKVNFLIIQQSKQDEWADPTVKPIVWADDLTSNRRVKGQKNRFENHQIYHRLFHHWVSPTI